jgi:hypothetical protein
LLLTVAAGLAVAIVRVASWRPLPVHGDQPADGYTRVAGVIHVHTTLSDGGGTPNEVIRAARDAGARFVVITDHNNADAKSFEGYHDGVLVIVGSELSTTAGHILGLGISDPTYRFSGDALDGLDDIKDLGGFAVAAHPFSPREDFQFQGFDLPGDWGLELINGDSEWRNAGPRVLSTALLYGINHRRALLGLLNSPDTALLRWDLLLAKRDVIGLAGADAHSRLPLTRSFSIRFPSYEALFALLRNHVLLDRQLSGDLAVDRALVLDALRGGRVYVGLDGLAPADAFSFVADSSNGRVTMGETTSLAPGLRLKIGGPMPKGATIELLRDGRVIATGRDAQEAKVMAPGVYRVQVRVAGFPVPWILSNPIYVFDDEEAQKRAGRAAWPVAQEPPPAAEILTDFNAVTPFQPGSDPSSSVSQILEPHAGADGGGAARLDFRLGTGTASNRSSFVATVDWTHRDLQGKTGIVFSIRADGVYRVGFQVRDENPASSDEGTEWWFASVRTSSAWKRVTIPFSRLRSINPMTDGRLDLEKIRALVFVMDRGAIMPGTRGRIWLDDLGVY